MRSTMVGSPMPAIFAALSTVVTNRSYALSLFISNSSFAADVASGCASAAGQVEAIVPVLGGPTAPPAARSRGAGIASDGTIAGGLSARVWSVEISENVPMKVRRVFHQDVVCIEGWESLREAARRMRAGGFSCLPVVSADGLLGIITERDVVEAMAGSDHPEVATVFDYMTEAPTTVCPDDDCSVAATEMLSVGCRHLPVMERGMLVGIVSARDL